jgi:hypothetical protein
VDDSYAVELQIPNGFTKDGGSSMVCYQLADDNAQPELQGKFALVICANASKRECRNVDLEMIFLISSLPSF